MMYPSIIGLIIDYFPVYRSTTAVAILSVGSQAGIAMNFSMFAIIAALGWRFSFEAVGIFFIAVGFAILFLVKDPQRGGFSYNYKPSTLSFSQMFETYWKVISVPCATLNLLGFFCRNWATSAYL